jgi:hypothetical protein
MVQHRDVASVVDERLDALELLIDRFRPHAQRSLVDSTPDAQAAPVFLPN